MEIKIDISIIKKLLIYSAVFGAFLALLSLIPFVMPFVTLFLLPFLGAPIVLTFMAVKKDLNSSNPKECAILGAISGIISGSIFIAVFVPLVVLIHLFLKNYFTYGLQSINFFLFIVLIITAALMYAVTNAGTGLLTGVVLQLFKTKKP